MKKTVALLMALAMIFALAACGGGGGTETPAPADTGSGEQPSGEAQYVLKLAHPYNEGSSNYEACELFAKTVEEVSGGAVHVDIFPSNTLGTTEEVEEGLAYGTCDIVYESIASLGAWSNLANIDAYPYIFSSLEHFLNVWQSDFGDQLREEIGEEGNFKLLGTLYRGTRIVTSSTPVYDVEGFNGFKLRTPTTEMYIKTWQHLGSSATPLPASDIFTAIQQGTVLGQENPIVDSWNFGLYDVCDYVIKTDHVYSQCTFIFSRDKWEAFPEEVKGWIEEAVKAAEDYKNEYTPQEEQEYYQRWEDYGATIIEVDQQSFMDAFADFAETEYPEFVEYIDQIKAMDPALEAA